MLNPYGLARPLLFALDPERAHELTLATIDRVAQTGALRLAGGAPVDDPIEVMGLRFRNRVGLAAGLDKNGAHIDALAALGFGFIEVGTVTPKAQPGNPRPRMFRLPEADALINRMGFNNDGVDAFVQNVARSRFDGVLGLNIGKNASTPIERATDDYLHCLERVYPRASYVTVNISSPNTKNLRQLQGADELDAMLAALRERQLRLADRHGRYVPLALKIAPDLDDDQIDAIAQKLAGSPHRCGDRHEHHGLARSGDGHAPRQRIRRTVRRAAARDVESRDPRAARPDAGGYPIIGVGGVMSGADACAKIDAGATLVQVYTGLVYRGPALVRECALALRAHCAGKR